MSGGGGSGGTTTQIQQADPWAGVQPYLQDLFGRGAALSQQPRQYFPGSTVVPFAPQTQTALAGMQERAISGSPLVPAAQEEALRTLGGQYFLTPGTAYQTQAALGGYLGSNPWLEAQFERAAAPVTRAFSETVMPGVQSAFSLGGRYGSGAHQAAVGRAEEELGRTLGGLATGLYGDAYTTERALQSQAARDLSDAYMRERLNQMQVLGGAPGLAQADYMDMERLLGVGAQYEDLSARNLQDAIDRWTFQQQEPWQRLQQYQQLLQPGLGFGTTASTGATARKGNPMAGALGGGLAGAQLGSYFMPGIGTGIGAVGGAILGGLMSR